MPLTINHSAGGGIWDVNYLNLGPASKDVQEAGRKFGRLDTAMNYTESGRLKRDAVSINPSCPNCFMIFPDAAHKLTESGSTLWTCPDCADLFETNAHVTITRK